jgi:hypothetical protein
MRALGLVQAGCIIAIALSLCNLSRAQNSRPAASTQAKPRIIVGKDTTRLTGPLREDGTVDFIAAIDREYSKGVTKDNNAAVVFIQVLDLSKVDKKWLGAVLKRLDMEASLPGPFLKTVYERNDNPPEGQKEYNSATSELWYAKDHPDLANWLRANLEPLEKLVAGTARTKYYMPYIWTQDADGFRAEAPMASILQPYLSIGRMLLIRANLALAERRYDEARRDILAVYRLGTLVCQDQTLIARMIGVSLGTIADLEVQHVCSELDLKTRKALIEDIRQLPSSAPVASVIDGPERYLNIQTLCRLAEDPDTLKPYIINMKLALGPLATTTQLGENPFIEEFRNLEFVSAVSRDVDWNKVLRELNQEFDRIVDAAKTKEPELKRNKFAGLNGDWDQVNKWVRDFPKLAASREVKTRWAMDWIHSGMGSVHAFIRADVMCDRGAASRGMTVICLALSNYKAEKGKYPQKLADLSPAYLKALPLDPFTGKDFIYKPVQTGYIIYSVGENGIDSGGQGRQPGCDNIAVRADE